MKLKLTRDAGGQQVLRKLDLIAIKSLTSEKDLMNNVILEKTKWLGPLLLGALNCFLPLESRDISQRLSRSQVEKGVFSELDSTLSHALSIKLELTLSMRRFKFIFFKPGALFHAKSMRSDDLQNAGSSANDQKIRLCILPALYSVPAEEAGGCEERSSGLTANCNMSLTEAEMDELGSLDLVEKAIVLL